MNHQLRADARRIAGGALAFLRRLTRPPRDRIALGVWRASAAVARPGGDNRYYLRVVNPGDRPATARVVVEFRSAASPTASDEAHARFAKAIVAPASRPLDLALRYDWIGAPVFVASGIESGPDESWRGTLGGAGRYSIAAALFDGERELERLVILQDVA
jgi:hypothetical protein